jgi:hypothetical protein
MAGLRIGLLLTLKRNIAFNCLISGRLVVALVPRVPQISRLFDPSCRLPVDHFKDGAEFRKDLRPLSSKGAFRNHAGLMRAKPASWDQRQCGRGPTHFPTKQNRR